MRIEAIELHNFRAFKHAKLTDIPRMCILVGANGTGKSTLFQLFGFLKNAMKDNISVALTKLGGSKGFNEVRSRGADGPITITIKFRQDPQDLPEGDSTKKRPPIITYSISINEDKPGQPYVANELLQYRRGQSGAPWQFLKFSHGKGFAVTNEMDKVNDVTQLLREDQSLKAPNILAIKGLAQFEKFPAVRALGDLIENWHISDFHIADARNEPEVGYAEHLSSTGDNLPLVADFLYNNHRKVFERILEIMTTRVPGIAEVYPKATEEGKVLLRFGDSAFKEPFISRFVSDGTIKMFAYLTLLHDPTPFPLLCIEEPENQLYPALLEELAEEFRDYAMRGQQVMVSTHSYDFLNAAHLDEVFWLIKKDGYTTIQRAKDNKQVCAMMQDGDKLGRLWRMGYFEGVEPQ